MPPAQKPKPPAAPKKDMKVGPKAPAKAPAKAPTLAAQIKGLTTAGKGQPVTVPFNQRDLDIATYISKIKQELKKKFKHSWSNKYQSAYNTIVTNARKVPDALVYLQQVLKFLNPSAQVYTGKEGQKVAPGEFHGLPVPNIPLTPTAQQFAPTPENAAKAKALAEKIKAYEDEIRRLKDAEQKASAAMSKAKSQKDKLGGIDEKLLKYFTYIEKNCSEYLTAVRKTKRFLFRGQEDATLPVFVGYPRADREPKDSDPKAQKMADEFLSLMGFKALRGNSIFTSSDKYQASNYGDLYVIFPKNGFDFTWSTKHDDLVIHSVGDLIGNSHEDAEDVYYDLEDYYDGQFGWAIDSYELEIALCDLYELDNDNKDNKKTLAHHYKTIKADPSYKALTKAVNAWYDLDMYDDSVEKVYKTFLTMVNALPAFTAKFPVFSKEYCPNLKDMQKDIKKAKEETSTSSTKGLAAKKALAAKTIKNYGFTHENLDAALKSEHEVCVLGEYIAVDFEKYEEEVTKFFLNQKTTAPKKKAAPKSKIYSDDEYDDDEEMD